MTIKRATKTGCDVVVCDVYIGHSRALWPGGPWCPSTPGGPGSPCTRASTNMPHISPSFKQTLQCYSLAVRLFPGFPSVLGRLGNPVEARSTMLTNQQVTTCLEVATLRGAYGRSGWPDCTFFSFNARWSLKSANRWIPKDNQWSTCSG